MQSIAPALRVFDVRGNNVPWDVLRSDYKLPDEPVWDKATLGAYERTPRALPVPTSPPRPQTPVLAPDLSLTSPTLLALSEGSPAPAAPILKYNSNAADAAIDELWLNPSVYSRPTRKTSSSSPSAAAARSPGRHRARAGIVAGACSLRRRALSAPPAARTTSCCRRRRRSRRWRILDAGPVACLPTTPTCPRCGCRSQAPRRRLGQSLPYYPPISTWDRPS